MNSDIKKALEEVEVTLTNIKELHASKQTLVDLRVEDQAALDLLANKHRQVALQADEIVLDSTLLQKII